MVIPISKMRKLRRSVRFKEWAWVTSKLSETSRKLFGLLAAMLPKYKTS